MFLKIFLFFFILANIYVHGAVANLSSTNENANEIVKIDLLYECLCPFSKEFHIEGFQQVVTELSEYIEVNSYPYGNAEIKVDENGNVSIECQYGHKECYGNMLHACAIDLLNNITHALIFNSCLMDAKMSNGMSDDSAADKCGEIYKVDFNSIKTCAKSEKGLELLKHYGELSSKYDYDYVPYVLVNGVEVENDDDLPIFKTVVCKAFKKPPSECSN